MPAGWTLMHRDECNMSHYCRRNHARSVVALIALQQLPVTHDTVCHFSQIFLTDCTSKVTRGVVQHKLLQYKMFERDLPAALSCLHLC